MLRIFVPLIAFLALAILPSKVYALNCSGGKGPGSIEYSAGWKICNGTTGAWDNIDLSAVTGSCTGNSIDYSSSLQKHKFCVSSANKTPSCETTSAATGYCTGAAELKFTASDGAASDKFGTSVSVHGEIMAIGAPDAGGKGAVYMYKRVADSWQYVTKLTASDATAGDQFGYSVALSGNTLIVGAPNRTQTYANQGAAYFFTYNGTSWSQQQIVIPSYSGSTASNAMGVSVDIYGDTAVAGSSSGCRAYIFTRSGSVWTQRNYLASSCRPVSISGNTIAAGDSFSGGQVRIYTGSGATWTQQQVLTGSDTVAFTDYFGESIDLQGDSILIGAYGANAAYYFTRSGSTWTQQKKMVPSDVGTHNFGKSVALYGNYALIGAPARSTNTGSAYLFYGTGSTWSQLSRFVATDTVSGDYFGQSVAFYGTTAVAGAYLDTVGSNASQGSAYIIPLLGLKQTFTGTGIAASDMFGAGDQPMSIDGDTLVIGAYAEDVGGTDTGAAYVFVRDAAGVWAQQQKITPTVRVGSEVFGKAVAVYGNTLVVGAPGFGTNQGRIYIFTRSGSMWTQTAGSPYTGTAATNQNFGKAVDIYGDTIAVGQSGATVSATTSGLVRVYRWDGTTLSAEQVINRPVATNSALFGDSLDLDGNVLVVGSPGNSVAGRVWVFNRNVTVWDAGTELVNSSTSHANDSFGRDVYHSIGTVAIGRPASAAASQAQAVVVYTGGGTGWTHQQTFTGSDVVAQPDFGNQVAIYGDQMVVSAAFTNSNKGAVYFFKRVGTTWTQAAKFISPNQYTNELFGNGVAIVDGYIMATSPGFSGNSGNVFYYSTTGDPVNTCTPGRVSAKGPSSSTTKTAATTVSTGASAALTAGQSLLVCVVSHTDLPASVTWNGVTNSTPDARSSIGAGVNASIYSFHNVSAGSTVISASVPGGTTAAKIITSMIVDGLATTSTLDRVKDATTGTSTAPDSGVTAATTTADEVAFACIGVNERTNDGAVAGTWQDGFTANDYQVTTAAGGAAGTSASAGSAYKVLSTISATPKANKTGVIASTPWAATVATYKASYANSGTTTTCSSYGACSVAGQLDYSSSAGGILWCDGAVWRKIKTSSIAPLGTFNIAGITGGTDTTQDAILSDLSSGVVVNYAASTGATSYDVTIKDSAGSTTICSTTGATTTAATVSGCSLVDGTSYKAYVTATDGSQSQVAANNGYSFTYSTVVAITVVQSQTATSGGTGTTNLNLVFGSSVAVGNTVILAVAGRVSSDVTTVSGLGATWTKRHTAYQSFNNLEIWTAVAVSAGTTVTINNTASNLRVNLGIEVSGLTGTLDVANTATFPNSFTIPTGSFTNSVANTIVFAAAVVDKNVTLGSGPTNGFTVVGPVVSAGGVSNTTGVAAYKIVSTSAAQTTTWTMSGTGSPAVSTIALSVK